MTRDVKGEHWRMYIVLFKLCHVVNLLSKDESMTLNRMQIDCVQFGEM